MAQSANEAEIYACTYNGTTVTNLPNCTVMAYINNVFVAQFSVTGNRTYTANGYNLSVSSAVLPNGYYFKGKDHIYNGGLACTLFSIRKADNTSALSNGDSFMIAIV